MRNPPSIFATLPAKPALKFIGAQQLDVLKNLACNPCETGGKFATLVYFINLDLEASPPLLPLAICHLHLPPRRVARRRRDAPAPTLIPAASPSPVLCTARGSLPTPAHTLPLVSATVCPLSARPRHAAFPHCRFVVRGAWLFGTTLPLVSATVRPRCQRELVARPSRATGRVARGAWLFGTTPASSMQSGSLVRWE